MKPGEYTENRLLRSPMTGKVYFVTKARFYEGGYVVVGQKIDVTEDFYQAINTMGKLAIDAAEIAS